MSKQFRLPYEQVNSVSGAKAAMCPTSAPETLALLRSHAAAKGIAIHLVKGSYLVQRWGFVRELPSINELKDFMQRMGVAI